MRMWCVNPSILCHHHLLGEHVELHMLVGSILKGTSLTGFIEDGLVDFSQIVSRHQELVEEMKKRGYRHQSPLPEFTAPVVKCKLDPEENLRELARRCPDCARQINRGKNHG